MHEYWCCAAAFRIYNDNHSDGGFRLIPHHCIQSVNWQGVGGDGRFFAVEEEKGGRGGGGTPYDIL